MKTGERVAVVMTGLYRITSGRRDSQLAPYAYQAECASYKLMSHSPLNLISGSGVGGFGICTTDVYCGSTDGRLAALGKEGS
jgi:hypothetical protein